jgi:hypothetical protein
MEEKIGAAEEKAAALQQRLEEPAVASDHVRLQETWNDLQAAQAKVAELYARWEELEARNSVSTT